MAIINNAAVNMAVHVYKAGYPTALLLILFGICPEVELLDHILILILIF